MKNGGGIKHGNGKAIRTESMTTGRFFFLTTIIFKLTRYSILQRLKQLGYESEVASFTPHKISYTVKPSPVNPDRSVTKISFR